MYEDWECGDYDDDDWEWRRERFADPGGDSALHAATKDDPRIHPCPTCHWPNRLTGRDLSRHYQCDACARAAEQGYDIQYYEGGEDDADELDESPE